MRGIYFCQMTIIKKIGGKNEAEQSWQRDHNI